MNRIQTPDPWLTRILADHRLVLDLSIACQKDLDQGAGLQRPAGGANVRQLLALAEDLQEIPRVPSRRLEAPVLVENDGPGEDRENEEQP